MPLIFFCCIFVAAILPQNLILSIMSSLIVKDFDFTGKRVKYQGRVCTKFDLCYLIDSIKYSYAVIRCDVLKYDDAVTELKRLI